MNAISEKPAPAQQTSATLIDPPAAATTAPPPPRSRRRLLLVPAALLALAVGGMAGHWWLTEGRWIESTDNAYAQGDITVLSPRVEGDVVTVRVSDNQRVKAGDPLVELDPADWKARVAQAEASVAEAQATVRMLQAQIVQQRTNLAAAAANRAHAEADRERTARDATRAATLQTQGWTSQQANELAISDSRKAIAALTAAAAQESSAADQIAVFNAQLQQAQARQAGAEAQWTLARNNLSYMTIRAPFDGIVGNRAAEPGKHVAPGTQLLALAPPPEQLYVTANFKETQLRRMRPGQRVRLVPDIDPGAAVDGVVDSLAPATGALFSLLPPENATGNFTKIVQRVPVKIRINPEDAARATWLRAGLSVTTEVDTRGPDAVRLGLVGATLAAVGATRP